MNFKLLLVALITIAASPSMGQGNLLLKQNKNYQKTKFFEFVVNCKLPWLVYQLALLAFLFTKKSWKMWAEHNQLRYWYIISF